jgi:hypothetical protein
VPQQGGAQNAATSPYVDILTHNPTYESVNGATGDDEQDVPPCLEILTHNPVYETSGGTIASDAVGPDAAYNEYDEPDMEVKHSIQIRPKPRKYSLHGA